jgi:hypothetical protein
MDSEAKQRKSDRMPEGQVAGTAEQHHIDIRNGHGERRLPDGRVLRVKVAQGKKRRARMPLIITIEPNQLASQQPTV